MNSERADPTLELMRGQTVYDWVLHVEKLAHAAELIAEDMPALETAGAPPLHYLLELVVFELRALAGEVSD